MGAKPRRIVQNRQSERDIEREVDQVYDFEYNDIKEADRLLALLKEEDAEKRARARAAGTPMVRACCLLNSPRPSCTEYMPGDLGISELG